MECARHIWALTVLLGVVGSPLGAWAQGAKRQPELRVFISADMEGIGGVVHGDYTSSSGPEYGRARKWMTAEVNAAIEGALAAGATEVLVNDSHGSMRNILVEELNKAAALISGSPKPLSMMQGIDGTFEAVIFVGYHAAMGTEAGILDHTYYGSVVSSIRVNGRPMNEAGLNAGIAGYYGVPVVMITGDQTVVSQTKEILPGIEGVVVKEGVSRYAAKVFHPERVQGMIREAARRAVENRRKIQPFKFGKPMELEIDFLKSDMADNASIIPGVQRKGARTVSYVGQDYVEVFRMMRALIALAAT